MPDAQFIRSPDGYTSGSGGIPTALPDDFVAASAQRLGWAALIYAVTYTIAYSIGRFVAADRYAAPAGLMDAGAVISIGLALGIYLAARQKWLAPLVLLDVGMIFWVVGAVGIDFPQYVGLLRLGIAPSGLSWVCVWLVVFPLVVPNTPYKTTLAAVLTASMGPLSFVLASFATGATFPPGTSYVQIFIGYYLCAAMAVLASRIVYRMGQDVERAREMGSYRLVELLGKGGMGEVWRARHKMLARPAAIKLLKVDDVGAAAFGERRDMLLRRFEREAQATSQLRSPHTIQLYDFGLTGDGSFYFAMELLEGLTLDDLVKRYGPLPPARVVYILRQICASLCEAHNSGLVHRDVKPRNIYVTRLGSSFDFVKVLDFGLVKKQGIFGDDDTQLTMEGSAPGTPDYMAPEIARGSRDIDARADIYSLGCVAFFLLTGQSVFQGDTPMEIVIAQANSEPELPSARGVQPIPPALEAVVMSCLAKDPGDRPGSATGLSKQLGALELDDQWDNHTATDWWFRHKPTERVDQDAAVELEVEPRGPAPDPRAVV